MPRRQRDEGSVYQRCDHPTCPKRVDGERPKHKCQGRWVAELDLGWREGKRRKKKLYATTQKEAVRRLNEAKRDLAVHGDLPTASPTVEAWMNKWLTEIAGGRIRPTTLPSYQSKTRTYIVPLLGRHRLDKLSPDHVRGMYRKMATDGLSVATRQQTHAILRRALAVAHMEGLVTRNVATLVDAPGTKTNKRPILTDEQTQAVEEAARGSRMESRWFAAMVLGLRQGEALGLGWDQVHLDDGYLVVSRALARVEGELRMVEPKSETSHREVFMPLFVIESLERRREAYEQERQALGYMDLGMVWGRVNGLPMPSRMDWQAWRDLQAAAGVVPPVSLHSARHSVGTMLELYGVPLAVRMAILGHSQVPVAMRYTRVNREAQKAAWALVEERRKAIEA